MGPYYGICLIAGLLGALPGLAQPGQPSFTPPPPPVNQPNPANPNQRIRVPRPGAPGPNDINVVAVTELSEGSVRHLRGDVVIETIDRKLQADEVDYDEDTGLAEARGNVRFENFTDGDKLYCDHGKYNFNDETGIFWDVHGTSPAKIVARPGVLTTSNPFYFEGKWAERQEDRYVLHDGFITDCKVPKPWWRLTAPKFDIIPNDRAIAYHGVFHIRRFPLFYSPAFYKSLKKTPRKSGFLTPHIGHSSRYGAIFGLGYYWAINRSYDLLYEGQFLSERGVAHTFDFRGKVRPGTDFNFNLYGVNDRGIKIGDEVQKQGGVLFSFNGRSALADGWEAHGQINYLSSFLFRQSFTESFHEAIFSESHSVGYLTKHWSSFGVNLIAERGEEFQSVAPDDVVVIRKLPEVQFLSREREILNGPVPVWFSLESSAGFVDRRQPDFQTRRFVERLDVYPRLTTAFEFAGFRLVPSFAVRETNYGSSVLNGALSGQDVLRSSREARIELLPPALARIYKSPKWLGGERVKHVIEPRVEYVFVDGVSDFRRIIRFDENDLLTDTNEVRVSVANRLFVKNKDGAVNEVLTWELSESRYFDPTFGGAVVPGQRNVVQSSIDLTGFAFLDGPRRYSPIASTFRLQQPRVGFEWRMDYDPVRKNVSNSGFTADMHFSQYYISLGHNQVRSDPVLSPSSNQFRGLLGIGNPNRKGWNAAFSAYYDYKREILEFATTQVTYNTDCCGISFQFRRFNIGTRDETQYRVAFAVSNIGTFGTLKKQERIF